MFEQIFQSKLNRLETICECLENKVEHFCELISSRLEVDCQRVIKEFRQAQIIFEFSDDELASYFKEIKKEKKSTELLQKKLEKEQEKLDKLELAKKLKEEKKAEKEREKLEKIEMKRQEKLKLKEEKQLQKLNEKALVKKKSPSITTIASKKYDWTSTPINIQTKDNSSFWESYNIKIEGCQYMCSKKTCLIYQKISDHKYELFGIKELDNECILEESLDNEIKIWAYASNIIVPSISQELIAKAHSLNNKHQEMLYDQFDDLEVN